MNLKWGILHLDSAGYVGTNLFGRKKGFQGKTLKAFIICGWLTRIRT